MISWKKVKGASGYEVYRSTKKNGKYKKIKTIKKAGTVRFTDKKLKKGSLITIKSELTEKQLLRKCMETIRLQKSKNKVNIKVRYHDATDSKENVPKRGGNRI